MSSQHLESSSGPILSSTYFMYIKNQNTIPVNVIQPNGTRQTINAGDTYSSYAYGVHTVVAPGDPDVVYFKVNYADRSNMSTEKGPLSGDFMLSVRMI
ncbi:hypothetical protein GALMADRAFT_234974 [Galerina marginata CBS 339.88]|uniref:Uncharacterized protein n=1 Tax=Galerina marginata (strain CBS 339.88) TaxID=685588 RepID=A0A067TRK9_GALM3|nr:hypothetical protein GALMADRAFT_234974 [Galerina marginata CBS 339.88]